MAARVPEADRLRACRLRFERALRDGITMTEADTRLSLERIAERRRRIEAIRTRAAPVAADRSTQTYHRNCALLGERDDQED
ncbi:hypothetical protein [Sphingomonas hengshuiensis]|nr:hypothetical protein [Sphingomonas hengshuiensis]